MAPGLSVSELELQLTLFTLAFFVLFSACFDFFYDRVEKELEDREHYQYMIRKIFKEMVNLGLITIILTLVNDFGEITSVTFNTIHVVHLWVFLSVMSYVIQALFTMILVRKVKQRWDTAFSTKSGMIRSFSKPKVLQAVMDEYDELDPDLPARGRFWRLLLGKRLFREHMELWIYRSYFLRVHALEPDFNFAQFLRRALAFGIREQVDIDWKSWMVVLIGVLIGAVAVIAGNITSSYSFDSQDMGLVAIYTSTVLFFLLFGMLMLLEDARDKLLYNASDLRLSGSLDDLGPVFKEMVLQQHQEDYDHAPPEAILEHEKQARRHMKPSEEFTAKVFYRLSPGGFLFVIRMMLLLQSFILGLVIMVVLFRQVEEVCDDESSNGTRRLAEEDKKCAASATDDIFFILEIVYVCIVHLLISTSLLPRFARTFYLLKAVCLDFKNGADIIEDVRIERRHLKHIVQRFSSCLLQVLLDLHPEKIPVETFQGHMNELFREFDIDSTGIVSAENMVTVLGDDPFLLYLTRKEGRKLLKYYFVELGITRSRFVPFCHQVLQDDRVLNKETGRTEETDLLLETLRDVALREQSDLLEGVAKLYPEVYPAEKKASVTQHMHHHGELLALLDPEEDEDGNIVQYAKLKKLLKVLAVPVLLYFFFLFVHLLENALFVLSTQSGEWAILNNPLSGVMLGIIGTALFQTSSATTSLAVAAVSSGIVTVKQMIPFVMGANIGTAVSSTIAAIRYTNRDLVFSRRGFAAGTLSDLFNIFTTVILLPVEVITNSINNDNGGLLQLMTEGVTPTGGPETFWSALTVTVGAMTDPILNAVFNVEQGFDNPGLAGGLGFAFGLVGLFVVLFFLGKNLVGLLNKDVKRILKESIDYHSRLDPMYYQMFLGFGFTVLVQSSAVTTSILIPLVAVGAMKLESLCPYTWGANLGTTITAIFASFTVSQPQGLQIALVHLLFNLFGLILLYPVRAIRGRILKLARWLGRSAAEAAIFPYIYTVMVFFVYPLILLGVSEGVATGTVGAILAVFCLVWVVLLHLIGWYYWDFKGGRESVRVIFQRAGRFADMENEGEYKSSSSDEHIM